VSVREVQFCGATVKGGGPDPCSRPCVECPAGDHHFVEPCIETALEEPEHEAAFAGVQVWWVCKHCDAWREWTGEEDEAEEI